MYLTSCLLSKTWWAGTALRGWAAHGSGVESLPATLKAVGLVRNTVNFKQEDERSVAQSTVADG